MDNDRKIIVAVDDEVLMEVIFKLHLKNEIRSGKIDFIFFEKAKDSLQFIEENQHYVKIVLLLSDINMPEMDGLTLLEVIKSKHPNIKIYMASAYDTDEYKTKAKNLGAEGYLTKPIDFEKLKKVIREVL